jgi:AcrR family transcriptional regulator
MQSVIKNDYWILPAAYLIRRGVESVSMSAIAQAAKVGKGTLYRHFSDKGELLHALLDEDMRQLQEQTLNRMREGHPPYQNLTWFIKEALSFVIDNSDALCEASNNGSAPMLQHPAHLWWRQTIVGLLTQSGAQGDLSYMTDIIYVMLDVSTIRFQRRVLGYDRETYLTRLPRVA